MQLKQNFHLNDEFDDFSVQIKSIVKTFYNFRYKKKKSIVIIILFLVLPSCFLESNFVIHFLLEKSEIRQFNRIALK